MAKLDTKFVVNDKITTEFHVGNTSGDSGTNPLGPADAPIVSASIVILGNSGKQLNVVTPYQKIVNPA